MKSALRLGAAVAPLVLALSAAPALADVVTGRVTDAAGVRVLQGAEVRIVELDRRAEVGPDGLYRFSDVAPGRYTLRVDFVGAQPSEQPIEVSGGLVTVDVGLNSATPFVNGDNVESVIVVGQRANLASSLSRQRAADGVESVLTRDAIGQFPDQNVAESVRRVTGVNVLNDQGEGRFIAVRGLSPDLNSASINGARVPAPEADVRSVALDVIPSEVIESIEIKKTLTPDMDGDTIGASIEIHTTNAFDRGRPFLSVTAEGSYNDATEEWSPKASLDASRTFGDRLGVAVGLSYYKRRFATDNIEMDGWGEADDGTVYADTVEYRDYDVERERIGGSLSIDYRASDNTSLYLRLLRSEFADQEYRNRLTFEMDGDPTSASGSTVNFASGDSEIVVTRDLKDRFEAQDITSLVGGGETFAGDWTFTYELSWSKAREKEDGSVDPVAFERKFEDAGEFAVGFDYADWHHPTYSVPGAFQGVFSDPSEYEFDKAEITTLSLSEDEETAARFDASREFALSGGGVFELSFGAKARQREKSNDFELNKLKAIDDLTLEDFVGPQSYGLADISPAISFGISDFIRANMDLFEPDLIDNAFESAAADYDVNEDVYAGYLMGRYDNGQLQVIGGVRVERTEDDIAGNAVQLIEEGNDLPDGTEADDDTVIVTPTRYENSYTHWLPSVNVKYEAAEDLVLRGAVYRSIMRPKIGDIAPRFLIDEDNEGEFGNPNLLAYEAWNYDLSAEWYFATNAVIQGGLFYKSVQNFIVTAEFDGDDPALAYTNTNVDEATMPINGDEATVFGFEFNYQQAMTFLPSPFDGLLVGFNYTYTDSEGEVDGRTITLPASAENTFNANLGYEKGPLSLRVAASYRDMYLDELGGEADEDRMVEDHLQWDVSAKYDLTNSVQIFAEGVNLGDAPYVAYQRGPGTNRLLQYEEYSWTGKFGVRVRF